MTPKLTPPSISSEFQNTPTARDIMARDARSLPQCVDGRIPGGLVLLAGRPKTRKSWAALQIALAVSTGRSVFGRKLDKARVLMLAYEDNDIRIQKRLEFFGVTRESAPDLLHFEYSWPQGAAGAEKIRRWIAAYPDTKLVVIDVLQRFRGPSKAKSPYDADYQTMSWLHRITAEHPQLTILVVHHTRKGGAEDPIEAVSGTFGVVGAADAYIVIVRSIGPNKVSVHIDGRDWDNWQNDFAWEFVEHEGWTWVGEVDSTLTSRQSEVIQLVRNSGFVTPSDLAKVYRISPQAATDTLRRLVERGYLFLARRGRYELTR